MFIFAQCTQQCCDAGQAEFIFSLEMKRKHRICNLWLSCCVREWGRCRGGLGVGGRVAPAVVEGLLSCVPGWPCPAREMRDIHVYIISSAGRCGEMTVWERPTDHMSRVSDTTTRETSPLRVATQTHLMIIRRQQKYLIQDWTELFVSL